MLDKKRGLLTPPPEKLGVFRKKGLSYLTFTSHLSFDIEMRMRHDLPWLLMRVTLTQTVTLPLMVMMPLYSRWMWRTNQWH